MNADQVVDALLENPPEIPGFEWDMSASRVEGGDAVWFRYEADDGAVVGFTLTATDVKLNETRVKPEPHEPEKGDDGRC